jgi:hypothetical protein
LKFVVHGREVWGILGWTAIRGRGGEVEVLTISQRKIELLKLYQKFYELSLFYPFKNSRNSTPYYECGMQQWV